MASQDDQPDPLTDYSTAQLQEIIRQRSERQVDAALDALFLRLPAAVGHLETVALHDPETHRWLADELGGGSDTTDLATFLASLRVMGQLASAAKDRRAPRS